MQPAMFPAIPRTCLLLSALLWLPGCGRQDAASGPEAGGDSVLAGVDAADPAASLREKELGPSAGKVVFPKSSVELGEVRQESTRDVVFPFTVEGAAAAITGLNPSCGCTRAVVRVGERQVPLGEPLPEGTQGEVVATFASQRFRNEKTTTVEVRGNAANLPEILKIHATIVPFFDPDPVRIFFGEVPRKSLVEGPRTVRAEVHAVEPFTIRSWIRAPRGITLREVGHEVLEDGGALHAFEAVLGADAPIGRLTQTAVAETSLGVNLEFLIQATVLGPVRYLPERRIAFGIVEAGRTPTRVLRIQATSDDEELPEPQVELVDGQGSDTFTWVVQTKVPGKEYAVRIRILPDAPPGRKGARLRISWPEGSGLPAEILGLTAILR